MKSLKQLFFIWCLLSLVLTSCNMEKRVYMSGYHMDWRNGKSNSSQKEIISNYKEIKTGDKEAAAIEQIENKNSFDQVTTMPDESITASATKEQIILPQKGNLLSHAVSKPGETKSVKPMVKKEIGETNGNPEKPRINGMALAGFICSFAGALLLVLFGFPFFMGLLGIIFSSIGLRQIKKDPAKWKGKGFAIAGLIIGIIDVLIFLAILVLLLILILAFI